MQIEIIEEAGYQSVIKWIAYNKKQNKDMTPVANKLACLGDGHDKFMRQIFVWMTIKAPRYWWQHFTEYRFRTEFPDNHLVVTQSESKMHTILKHELKLSDFQHPIQVAYLEYLNKKRQELKANYNRKEFEVFNGEIPESYFQERGIVLNYGQLASIIKQRKNHKMFIWHDFINQVMVKLEHPELFNKIYSVEASNKH